MGAMTTSPPSTGKPGKAWLAAEARLGRRAASGLVGIGLLGTLCAVGQAYCLAMLLAVLIGTDGPDEPVLWPALAFAGLAVARAVIGVVSESQAFRLGANARRRLHRRCLLPPLLCRHGCRCRLQAPVCRPYQPSAATSFQKGHLSRPRASPLHPHFFGLGTVSLFFRQQVTFHQP